MSRRGPFFSSSLLGDCSYISAAYVRGSNTSAFFLGSLLPPLLAVVLFATPRLRRQWSFRILTFALVFAIAQSLMYLLTSKVSLDTIDARGWYVSRLFGHMNTAATCMEYILPWICDCALLCKILSFHPAAMTRRTKRAAILAFPLAMHIPRAPLLLLTTVYFDQQQDASKSYGSTLQDLRVVESVLAFAENFYCSGFLLYKAHQFARADYAKASVRSNAVRLRLRHFMESVMFTFAPALAVQFAYLITIALLRYRSVSVRNVAFAEEYLRFLNMLFSVNFGLLAVWWSARRIDGLDGAQTESSRRADTSGSGNIASRDQDTSLIGWLLGPLEPERDLVIVDKPKMMGHNASGAEEEGQPDIRCERIARRVP